MHLAERTEIEDLRHLLQECAQQYRNAADDIRMVWSADTGEAVNPDGGRHGLDLHVDDGGDAVALWERTECETLTYFRDAYDTTLPPRLAATVKRHFEAGVNRLERLRKLQGRTR
ncbi:MAG: hypothetical protein ACXW2D_00115 [Burkholderiaceae bacterium]